MQAEEHQQRALPEWAEKALNGHSTRPARPWECTQSDTLAGEIVETRDARGPTGNPHKVLTVRVAAATEGGQPVEAGDWIKLSCHTAVLRSWVERDKPGVGDQIAVQFRGKARGALFFIAGVHRAPDSWE